MCGDDQQLGPIFRGAYPEPEDDGGFDSTALVFAHALHDVGPDHPGRAALTAGRRMDDVLTPAASALIYRPELAVAFAPADRRTAWHRRMLLLAGTAGAGAKLGIEFGSRLERVLEAKSEREAMRLERGLGLSR